MFVNYIDLKLNRLSDFSLQEGASCFSSDIGLKVVCDEKGDGSLVGLIMLGLANRICVGINLIKNITDLYTF